MKVPWQAWYGDIEKDLSLPEGWHVSVAAPDGYFELIREICDKYDVLFIADEVMTALGRTGKMWGIDHWNVTPDIIALSKTLTCGYFPVAAVIARDDIGETLRKNNAHFRAGHTLNASAVGMAAAIETIRYMQEHDLVENARVVGDYLLQRLHELLELDIIGDVRGKGLMCGLEFVKDKETKEPFPRELKLGRRFELEAIERGLILFAGRGCVEGTAGDMMLVTPPLVISRQQVDEMMDILKETTKAIQAQVLS